MDSAEPTDRTEQQARLEGIPLLVLTILVLIVTTTAIQAYWQTQFADAVAGAGLVTILVLTATEAIGR